MASGWYRPAARQTARLRIRLAPRLRIRLAPLARAGQRARAGAGRWTRRMPPRRSVRLRLTLLYGVLFLISGAGLLALTYGLVAHALPGGSVEILGRSNGGAVQPSGGVSTQHAGACPAFSGATIPSPSQAAACSAYLRREVTKQRAAELHQLLAESGFALAGMTIVSLGLGWLVAGRVLHPLRTITAAARRISATSLHERLALAGPPDELKELGDTFDGLLGRLEKAFDAQRQFVANASHELRSPLARQRTLTEVALADPDPTVASLRAVCARVLAAGQQQERLIEALLTLARSQRGLDRRTSFDLAAVAGEVAQARQPEAEAQRLRLFLGLEAALVLGDQPLMERLVANLVGNAVRHNTDEGWVAVMTGSRGGVAVLTVANSGPLIPAGEVARLYQPFQRLGANRAGHPESPGLGLSIAAAIVAAHDGGIYTRALRAGGLEVEARFPLAPAASESAAAGASPVPGLATWTCRTGETALREGAQG